MKNNLSLENKNLLNRNITLTYIIGSLMWGRFFIPVLALFYIASQVPLEQFTIIMSVFAFSTLILEIPTGALADLFGKKNTLLISRSMYIIEIFLIAFFNGFWVFLIAKIISGIGVSLSSGTQSAFLYDTLKSLNRKEEYKKIAGILNSITYVSMAFIFVIGAFLFTINPKLPAIASLPLITLGFILNFFLKEPYKPSKKFNLSNYLIHIKEGLTYFKRKNYLIYLAIFTFLIGSAISMILSLSSAYFEKILIPISIIGVIAFIGSMLTAFSSKQAYKIENFLGEKRSLIIIQVFVFSAILLMSLMLPYIGLLFFFIISFIQGFYEVILSDYVNRHIESSHRTIMLSINNMFDNIGIFLLFPVIGYFIKKYSMQFSFSIFSIFLGICFFASFLYYIKINK